MSYFKEIKKKMLIVKSKEDLRELLNILKVISSNHKDKLILEIIDKALQKSRMLNDVNSEIILLGLKIAQIYHFKENKQLCFDLLQKMKLCSEISNNMNGLAFSHMFEWLLERIAGNKERSSCAIQMAISILENNGEYDQYIINMCYYSYALELWLEHHDFSAISILEDCIKYFYTNGFYRSLAQSLSILSVIYVRMQSHESVLKLSGEMYSKKYVFEKLPRDIQAILHYFTGLGFMLEMKLDHAETWFEESYNVLKPIYKKSIYFSNYLTLHSYIVTVKALQGKLEQTREMISDVENLLQEEFFQKNLDSETKKQIHHTLNLNKFYVYSRSKNFDTEKMCELITEIFEGSKTLYSDFMLLSEFVLNANLKPNKLRELLKADNFSTNRIKHLISFVLLAKNEENLSKKNLLNRIKALEKGEQTSKTSFIEYVLTDLLIAQQLYSLRRFAEISILLRKYEKKLDRIQVLELRLFMEAFIQVGAYKNGDPLGP
ncbi:MAG: hypothetical protein GOP50_08035, partial [Candidatus Heimdallarchaeota archaeon]|nr:hypothetical protein [Candidatus Heimdallarchaeota archaeon]